MYYIKTKNKNKYFYLQNKKEKLQKKYTIFTKIKVENTDIILVFGQSIIARYRDGRNIGIYSSTVGYVTILPTAGMGQQIRNI